jgi:hypothetical protein
VRPWRRAAGTGPGDRLGGALLAERDVVFDLPPLLAALVVGLLEHPAGVSPSSLATIPPTAPAIATARAKMTIAATTFGR